MIRARTEAVTLMSADLSAKGKSTLDQLEDTRTEMKEMQRNFADREAQWKEETAVLKVDLESKAKRIDMLTKESEATEKIRFELSSKVAVLQEKVVKLQESLVQVKQEKADLEEKFDSDMDEAKIEVERLKRELKFAQEVKKINYYNMILSVSNIVMFIRTEVPKTMPIWRK